MNNIDPAVEELIRDSEKLRIITTLVNEEKSKYIDSDLLRMICGIEKKKDTPEITKEEMAMAAF